MHHYTPPSVCQISRQSDMAFAFYSSFCKCATRGRKIRRKNANFCISRERLKRFRTNLECGVLKLEGVSTAKIVLFHQSGTGLRRCEKFIYLFIYIYIYFYCYFLFPPTVHPQHKRHVCWTQLKQQ